MTNIVRFVILFLQALLVGNTNAKAKVDVVVPPHDQIWHDAYTLEVEKVLTITFACTLVLFAIILIFEKYIELTYNKQKIIALELSIAIANKVNIENTLESNMDRSNKIVFFDNPILTKEGEGFVEKINHRSSKIKKNIERLDAEIIDLETRNECYKERNSTIRLSLTDKKAKVLLEYGDYDADLAVYLKPTAEIDIELEGGVELEVGADVELNAGFGLEVEVNADIGVEGDLDAELAAQGELEVGVEVELEANVEVEVEAEVEIEVEVEAEAEA